VGRSLWFSQCASPARIAAVIGRFAPSRRNDLWSGVGLAATYAGGVAAGTLRDLLHHARGYETELGQGCCFAAKARLRAGNPVSDTHTACDVLLACSPQAAATLSDEALAIVMSSHGRLDGSAPAEPDRIPAYELWRQQVRSQLAMQGVQP
jgi:hypothetical protein